jgi:ABC-type transport system substrate-binding protein
MTRFFSSHKVSQRTTALLGTIAALPLIFSGCGGGSDSKSGLKIYDYVNIDLPKDFDPAYSKLVYDGIAGGLVMDGLVNFGLGSDVVPGLAEKWEVSADGQEYSFTLRTAKFSDGRPVRGEDVVYSLSRLLRPEVNSDRTWVVDRIVGAAEVKAGTTRNLSGITLTSSNTLTIRLDRPYPPFLTKLAMPAGGIIPEGAADGPEVDGKPTVNREFSKRPIGSGPWVLSEWRRDQRVEFIRNENYWGKKPAMDKFIYHMQDNDSVQRQMLAQGKVDIYPTVGFGVYGQWREDPNYKDRMIPVPELNTYYLGVMCSKPHLQDKRIRQAIAHAVDTKRVFDRLQLQRGTLAHGPVPAGVDGYRGDLKPREYNPARSRELLAEAGATTLTLRLWVRTEAQNDEVAASIAQDLNSAGIPTEIIKRDYASINEAIFNGEPDLFLWSWWLDYPDIENAVIPTFHSKNIPRSGNRAHFRNAELDALLDKGESEADPKKRIALFQQAEDLIREETPWIPLYHRKTFAVTQPWVQGFKPALMYNANRYTEVDLGPEGIGK